MTELLPFLKSLISAPGLSGHEDPIRSLIAEEWNPLCDELSTSRLGSLHAVRYGNLPEPRPRLLLAAHMDSIGMMVTSQVGEFLHITQVGGIDPRVLPGQLVTLHGRKDLPAVIVQPPAALLPDEHQTGPVPLEHLLVDAGLAADELSRMVRPGDLVSFAQPPLALGGDYLAGHSLDNRASVAALTHCLHELQQRPTAWDVWAVATVQEEETLGGALTSAYHLQPTLAVAIDMTFGASPGSPSHKTFPIGKGITVGWGPNIHPGLHRKLKSLADRLEIPCKLEVMPRHSGTDAFHLQIALQGIPTAVVGIPLRYMHTPVEMVSMKDIARLGRLLAEFAASLDENFMDGLKLDE